MRVALYARVSTVGQDPAMQLEELRTYAERRGFEVVHEYVDHGVSGTKDRRPSLDRLMRDAHRRTLDSILVWKLDRFGRSLRHLVNALAELEARGVAFVSLRDNLDLSTPAGRLMFQIIAAMAEFERSLTVERVKAGMAIARNQGKHVGRPAVPVDASLVFGLVERGLSRRAVAKRLGVSEAKIRRVLAGCVKRVSGNGAGQPGASGVFPGTE